MKKQRDRRKKRTRIFFTMCAVASSMLLVFLQVVDNQELEQSNTKYVQNASLLHSIVKQNVRDGDTRILAENHPLSDSLAPAVGRIREGHSNAVCTAWIAQGGILITAGHCTGIVGDTLEFNVPLSESDGDIVPSAPEDRYPITNTIAKEDGGEAGKDWRIFEVDDNLITGLQPIEAQLRYITFKDTLVDETDIPTLRHMGYGSDQFNGTRNHVLLTEAGDNLTSGSSNNRVRYDIYSVQGAGSSGGPVIDESTGHAVGVHNGTSGTDPEGNAASGGTTAHRQAFWTAFDATQNTFTLLVTQKDAAGSYLSGSTISRWNVGNEEFDNYTLSGSSVNFGTVWEGNAEVFRADQGVYNNPKEKYNEWTGFSDVRNHRVFQLQDQLYTSQFQKTHSNITITTKFPEYTLANGSGAIKFKDPWLIDYNDPDFDNSPRNRGMDAVFNTHSAPFTPGFNAINGKLYNGLFLNENITFDENLPNYTVRAEAQTINFGGSLGSRQVVPIGWEGDDADFEEPDEEETAVVFEGAGAEARAKMKVSRVSDETSSFKPYQRNVVRSREGWQHMVYESMGHIWYEAREPSGNWEIVPRSNQRLYLDETGGKSPSIDFNTYQYPWDYMTVVAWQEGGNIWYQTFYKHQDGSYVTGTHSSFQHGQSSSYNTQPNVVWSDDDEFAIFWRSSSGIKFNIFQSDPYGCCTYGVVASGTIANTSGAYNMAVASFVDGNDIYFDIAWEKSESAPSPYYVQTKILFACLKYNTLSESVSQVGSNKLVSSGAYYRNKEPSITSIGKFDKVIGYISGSTTGSGWDPWNTWASTARVQNGPFSWQVTSRVNNDHHVRSVSVSKLSDNSEYYTGWSQIYDQQGYVDYNKFVEGSSPTSFKYLNTKGWDVQLTEAPSDNNIHTFSYYPKTQPYYWLKSNSLGSYLKQLPVGVVQSRGIVLSDTSHTTGFYYGVGAVRVAGAPVVFSQVETQVNNEERAVEQEEPSQNKPGPADVQPWLVSEPFQLTSQTVSFTEEFSFRDSTAAMKLLGSSGHLTFTTRLVDAHTGEVLATLRRLTVQRTQGLSRRQNSWKLNEHGVGERTVRLEISAETNLGGLYAEVESFYLDEGAHGKIHKQEPEELTLAEPKVTEYALAQNYPNPFNPTTKIGYQLPEAGNATLVVYDLLGRKAATLVNGHKTAGRYTVTFDASNLASGVYIYRLKAGDFTQSKKLYLIK